MTKITIILVLVAFVYCAGAAPNNPYNPFGNVGFNPFDIQEKIIVPMMEKMMNPDYLKNQQGDGSLAVAKSSMVNGKPEYDILTAKKENGIYEEHREHSKK